MSYSSFPSPPKEISIIVLACSHHIRSRWRSCSRAPASHRCRPRLRDVSPCLHWLDLIKSTTAAQCSNSTARVMAMTAFCSWGSNWSLAWAHAVPTFSLAELRFSYHLRWQHPTTPMPASATRPLVQELHCNLYMYMTLMMNGTRASSHILSYKN